MRAKSSTVTNRSTSRASRFPDLTAILFLPSPRKGTIALKKGGKPPYIQSFTDANTDTMTYDLLGRRFYVGFRTAF